MFKYLVPFKYLHYSRLKTRMEIYSLIWIYPLYLFLFIFLFYGVSLVPGVFLFFLLFTYWMLIYEIGYMENDAITIKKETNPNIRIPREDIAFIQKHFNRILGFRTLIFGLVVGFIYFLGLLPIDKITFFVIFVCLARGFFWLHNTIRSRYNILTYFFLCVSKYFVLPYIFLELDYGIEPYFILLFSFPVLRTIEHAVKSKYQTMKLSRLVGSLDKFRAIYYGTLFLAVCCNHFVGLLDVVWILSLGYFVSFRLAIFMMIKLGFYSRQSMAETNS